MNFNFLRYYVETINLGSINKAAKMLYINPSTLLAALNSIENEIGTPLLIRSHNGIKTTKAGEKFFYDAQYILKMQSNWSLLPADSHIIKRQINIAVIPSVYYAVFGQYINKVIKEDSSFFLSVKCYDVLQIENAFHHENISIAISCCLEGEESYIRA